MRRRAFLANVSTAALAACFPASLAGITRTSGGGKLERRSLGRTGESLSIIGLGGVVVMNATPEEASARVAHAIERGVNYFDVAPSYGNAEERLGPALAPYRKNVFLACKTQKRDRVGANTELESSLRHMQTDHFDLYQLHAVTTREDVEQIFAKDGAIETFEAARKAGKVRFLGFSAHSVDAALAMMDRFAFDTILFPVNFATWYAGSFGPQVLEMAQRKQMGILAIKSLARRPWPEGAVKTHPKCWYEPLDDAPSARDALRFTLSHPVTAAIPPGDENLFALALDLAADFEPLSPAEAEAIKRKGLATTPLFTASSVAGDPLLNELNAIAADFDDRVRAAGFADAGAVPSIVVDSRPQLSMYTRTDNTVHASRWEEASPDTQDVFARWAGYAGDRTGKQLFDEMFHRFFFVHELAHWLQVQAKRDSDDVYGFELEANRLTVAYWREKDPEYLTAVVSRLRRINEALTSPVPAGQGAEAYFNANYRNLGSNPNVYGWFQTRMVIAAGSERSAGTFAETVQRLVRR